MSSRGSSLYSLLIDGLCFLGVMCLAGAAAGMTPDAESNDSAAAENARLQVDHIDSRLNSDDNMPSGSQVESLADRRQSNILGMELVERGPGDIRVADVAATSPAWDAGIRRNDRILSMVELKPQSLSRWIRDVRMVLNDMEGGQAVSTQIERDNEQLALRIRLVESKAEAARDARQEERATAQMQGQPSAAMQTPGGVMPMQSGSPAPQGTTGTNVYVDGTSGGFGFLGGGIATDSGSTPVSSTAVAQLMATNTRFGGQRQTVSGSAVNGSAATSTAERATSGQVGVAQFVDNGQGVSAQILIQGLPQGNYLVGIGDGSAFTNGMNGTNGTGFGDGSGIDGFGNDGVGNDRRRNRQLREEQLRNEQRRQLQERRPMNARQQQMDQDRLQSNGLAPAVAPRNDQNIQAAPFGNPPAQNNQPLPSSGQTMPSGGAAPAGEVPADRSSGSVFDSRSAVLAQQIAPSQATQGNSYQVMQGNPSQATQGNTPASNMGTMPNTRSDAQLGNRRNGVADGRRINQRASNFGRTGRNLQNNETGGLSNASPFVNEIGVVQVGPDGSGRVSNQLEGMTVQNLAGMSVTVVAQDRQGVNTNTTTVGGNLATQQGNATNSNNSVMNGNAAQAVGGTGAPWVVATGIIELADQGQIPNTRNQQAGSAGERPVDEATERQRRQNPIPDPRESIPDTAPR